MHEVICQAIRATRLLSVSHNHVPHVVEPYALYPTPDETLMLEGRLVAGEDDPTRPLSHWCAMPLVELTAVTLLPQVFLPHPEYNAQPLRYQQAICRVARWPTRQ